MSKIKLFSGVREWSGSGWHYHGQDHRQAGSQAAIAGQGGCVEDKANSVFLQKVPCLKTSQSETKRSYCGVASRIDLGRWILWGGGEDICSGI